MVCCLSVSVPEFFFWRAGFEVGRYGVIQVRVGEFLI